MTVYVTKLVASTDVLPVSYGLERYESLWEKKVFIKGSLIDGGVDSSGAYQLEGLVNTGTTTYAIIGSSSSDVHMFVSGRTNEQGFTLVSVNMDTRPENVFVTINDGRRSFTVKYSPAKISILNKEG